MKEITIYDSDIKEILEELSENIFTHQEYDYMSQERSLYLNPKLFNKEEVSSYSPISEEYLKKILTHSGKRKLFIPEKEFSIPIWNESETVKMNRNYEKYKLNILNSRYTLKEKLKAKRLSLGKLYPENGYSSWHHTGYNSGYKIIFTFNLDSNGLFFHYTENENNIFKVKYKTGWNVHIAKYKNIDFRPKDIFWCAHKIKAPKYTLECTIQDKREWINTIELITQGNYEKTI